MAKINITESKLKEIVTESVKQFLSEGYNNYEILQETMIIKNQVRKFLNYIDSEFADMGEGDDRYGRLYRAAVQFEKELDAFIFDNEQQQKYRY